MIRARPLRAVSFVGSAGAPVRGSGCSLPASSEPRGGTGCAPPGPPAPGRDVKGEKWLKGRAEDAQAKQARPEKGKKRVLGREDALSPAVDTQLLRRAPGGKQGAPVGAEPHSPPLPG